MPEKTPQEIIAHNTELIQKCIQEYSIPANPHIDEQLLLYDNFPKSVSKKLAVLILTYQQEAKNDDLLLISSQPAGMIRALRKDGFIFQKSGNNYEYRNEQGQRVRKIIGIKAPLNLPNEEAISTIHLNSIHIQNFFCVRELQINNLKDKKEIYILGENGDGKTLLLQAIILGLKNYFIQNIADIKGHIGEALQLIRDSQLKVTLTSTQEESYSLQSKSFVKNLFAYGVHRNRNTSKNADPDGFATLFGEESYLRNPADWLRELERLNLKELPSIALEDAKKMLEELLNGNVEIRMEKEVLFIERGSLIKFEHLSEGYKSVITWVSDLVSRLAENQPDVTTIQDFEGIVLVDEVSMLLHPKWEYTIVKKLRDWFPKIQFIFTTHSPTTILGASEDAVFYRLYKKEGITHIAQPFTTEEINAWMANILITSPLFDLESARMRTFHEDTNLDTNEDFIYHKIHQKIAKKLEEKKNKGEIYISPEDIDSIMEEVIENFENEA